MVQLFSKSKQQNCVLQILINAKRRNLVRMEELVKIFQEVTNVPVKQVLVISEETAKTVRINICSCIMIRYTSTEINLITFLLWTLMNV